MMQADEFLKQVHVDGSHGVSGLRDVVVRRAGAEWRRPARRPAVGLFSGPWSSQGIQGGSDPSDPGWVRSIRSRLGLMEVNSG